MDERLCADAATIAATRREAAIRLAGSTPPTPSC